MAILMDISIILYIIYIHIWALIKIKVPGKGTIADQSRINRDPKGDNRGGILFFPMSCVQKIKALFYIEIYTSHKLVHPADPCLAKP